MLAQAVGSDYLEMSFIKEPEPDSKRTYCTSPSIGAGLADIGFDCHEFPLVNFRGFYPCCGIYTTVSLKQHYWHTTRPKSGARCGALVPGSQKYVWPNSRSC